MTDTEFDFTALETEETEPVAVNDSICNAPGCSNPTVAYSGRGPRPKKCATHKGKPASGKPRAKKKYGTDYTDGIAGLLQMPAMALGIVGAQTNNIALVADANVIAHHTPAIAAGLNDLAQERPEVAAVLDRILKVGPYGAILGAVIPMAVQLLANHKVIPPGMGGTLSAEQVLGIPTDRAEEPANA